MSSLHSLHTLHKLIQYVTSSLVWKIRGKSHTKLIGIYGGDPIDVQILYVPPE
jgi:hypothetical protein